MLCLCLVYEATSCVKKQKSFCACVYDVRIVQYDWSNNRSQALFKTIDHRSRLPNKSVITLGIFVKSLFSFSITCCIPSEPWSVNYPGSNQISLFCKQFWDEPWSDVNILLHPMKHRPDQGSISLSQS